MNPVYKDKQLQQLEEREALYMKKWRILDDFLTNESGGMTVTFKSTETQEKVKIIGREMISDNRLAYDLTRIARDYYDSEIKEIREQIELLSVGIVAWVARDKNYYLHLYVGGKPDITSDGWNLGKGYTLNLPPVLFPELHYTDEPIQVTFAPRLGDKPTRDNLQGFYVWIARDMACKLYLIAYAEPHYVESKGSWIAPDGSVIPLMSSCDEFTIPQGTAVKMEIVRV